MATARLTFGTAEHLKGSPHSGAGAHDRQAGSAGENGCVLLVDNDRSVAEMFTRAIRSFGLEVVSALTGKQALAVAHRVRFNLLLLHLKLRDIPGLDVVRALRGQGFEAPFIVMTGYANAPVAAEAMALGAHNVLEEPIHLDELCAAVARAIHLTVAERPGLAESFPGEKAYDRHVHGEAHVLRQITEPHAASERWCNFVMSLISCEHDLKTTDAWAKHVGVSCSVIREACRHVHVRPHDARDFGRMLGAIHRSGHNWIPGIVLDVADGRTLKKFEARSGFEDRRDARTPTIEQFLDRQQWIPRDNPALLVLRTLLLGGK